MSLFAAFIFLCSCHQSSASCSVFFPVSGNLLGSDAFGNSSTFHHTPAPPSPAAATSQSQAQSPLLTSIVFTATLSPTAVRTDSSVPADSSRPGTGIIIISVFALVAIVLTAIVVCTCRRRRRRRVIAGLEQLNEAVDEQLLVPAEFF
jgi:hypothetical protein